MDAESYHSHNPHKVLAQQESKKKNNNLTNCLKRQHKHFTPFAISMDGLIRCESEELLKRLLLCLTDKWE
jgi:hypothetical protein